MMIRFPATIATLLFVLTSALTLAQENVGTAPTGPLVFQVNVNGKPTQFEPTTLLAYLIKEDGSITITAQTSTDIVNSDILALSITPADTTRLIAKGQYKILAEDASPPFMVRAEYSSIEHGNISYWWSDTSHSGGGSVFIDEISASRIKGRFTFTGVLEEEDGSMNRQNLVKVTNGVFDLPLELRSRLDPR